MKKTQLVTLEFPPQSGGVSRYLYKLAINLPPDQIQVLVPPCSGDQQFDQVQPFKIFRQSLISNNPLIWPKWIFSYGQVKELIKKHSIKHIIVSHVLPMGTVAYMVNKKFGTPYTVICHGMDVLSALKKWRKKQLMIKVLNNASQIVVNSQYTASLIRGLENWQGKIVVITPGTDILNQPSGIEIADLRDKYKLADKKILLTVGRLVPRKGHDLVIKALSKLTEQFSDLVYLIVGEGPAKNDLIQLASSLQLKEKVIFTGEAPNNYLPAFYKLSDIFINVEKQIEEDVPGFGIVFLEANAFSKPVIGGRSGGAKEAVVHEKTGLLVDPNDLENISQAITRLLQDNDFARKLGEQGKQRVIDEFSWSQRAEKLKELLS